MLGCRLDVEERAPNHLYRHVKNSHSQSHRNFHNHQSLPSTLFKAHERSENNITSLSFEETFTQFPFLVCILSNNSLIFFSFLSKSFSNLYTVNNTCSQKLCVYFDFDSSSFNHTLILCSISEIVCISLSILSSFLCNVRLQNK